MTYKCTEEGTHSLIADRNVKKNQHLVLIQLTVFIFLLSLLLERDNDETDEDVHHEEGNDDDIDDEEDGDDHAVVVDGSDVLGVRVDGPV